jgi:hypothetical protein
VVFRIFADGLPAFWLAPLHLDISTGRVFLSSIEIQKHITVSDEQYSVLQMLFLLAYSVMYAGGGKLADWLGTGNGYSIVIPGWYR